MKPLTSLRIILIISLAGMLFSGYLSYGEVIAKSCPIGGCSNLFGLPVCVYGLAMYTIIFIISMIALCSHKK